jgi:hypothetical protein
MKFHRESRRVPCAGSAGRGRVDPGERTSAPLGSPSLRGGSATPPRRRARPFGVALLAGLALAGCEPYVQGNGVFLEEDRSSSFGPFTGLHVEDGIRVTLTANVEQQSVRVSGDANLLPYVTTEIRQENVHGQATKVLHLSIDAKDYDPAIPVIAVLDVSAVRYLSASQGSRIDARGAAATEMIVDARERSSVLLAGTGGSALRATLDAAEVDAGSYPVDVANVSLTNQSRIELHADVGVFGSAQGKSQVDNLLGDGSCAAVTVDAESTRLCREPAAP